MSEVLALTDRVMNDLNNLPVKSHADIVKKKLDYGSVYILLSYHSHRDIYAS